MNMARSVNRLSGFSVRAKHPATNPVVTPSRLTFAASPTGLSGTLASLSNVSAILAYATGIGQGHTCAVSPLLHPLVVNAIRSSQIANGLGQKGASKGAAPPKGKRLKGSALAAHVAPASCVP